MTCLPFSLLWNVWFGFVVFFQWHQIWYNVCYVAWNARLEGLIFWATAWKCKFFLKIWNCFLFGMIIKMTVISFIENSISLVWILQRNKFIIVCRYEYGCSLSIVELVFTCNLLWIQLKTLNSESKLDTRIEFSALKL